MNFIQLVRIGRDAEVRHTANGKAVTGFSAAYDVGWGDNKKTEWLDCSWWGDRGTKIAEKLVKGTQIVVQGTIGMKEYDGKFRLGLTVEDVQFAGSKPQESERSEARRTDKPRAAPPRTTGGTIDPSDDIPFAALHKRRHF